MAGSEAPGIEPLGPADAGAGLALSAASGWNQTGDDWRLFLAHGHSVGCRDGAGRLIASAAALPYAGGAGWISMVLVDPAWRHRGLASRLMDECIRHLRALPLTPTLDATPDGEAVYRRLGFAAGFAFARWEGEGGSDRDGAGAIGEANVGVRAARADDLERIAGLDAASLDGVGRAFLLGDIVRRPATQSWLHGEGGADGFIVARAGHRATQVGPLVASTPEVAATLLGHALARIAGRVFIDVPERAATTESLERRGFVRQRPYVRMTLGAAPPAQPHDTLYALAGPEFG
jgi:GNAT superfamily N-acetyltransferase